MKKGFLKKAIVSGVCFTGLMIVVLCMHIYIVTRPKAPDAHSVAMARVDFKQDISQQDAEKITSWLYEQKGIDHVLCNPQGHLAVFTFHPALASADEIIGTLRNSLGYNANRFMPSEADMKSGCPVASTSLTYKAYNFVRHIF